VTAAGFRALAAGPGTSLARGGRVPGAFVSAGLAGFEAHPANLFDELGPAGHLPDRQAADVGAGKIELDAVGQFLDASFLQASGCAGLAGSDAFLTGVNTSLVKRVRHGAGWGHTTQESARWHRGDYVGRHGGRGLRGTSPPEMGIICGEYGIRAHGGVAVGSVVERGRPPPALIKKPRRRAGAEGRELARWLTTSPGVAA
jgi:hypothetical protein